MVVIGSHRAAVVAAFFSISLVSGCASTDTASTSGAARLDGTKAFAQENECTREDTVVARMDRDKTDEHADHCSEQSIDGDIAFSGRTVSFDADDSTVVSDASAVGSTSNSSAEGTTASGSGSSESSGSASDSSGDSGGSDGDSSSVGSSDDSEDSDGGSRGGRRGNNGGGNGSESASPGRGSGANNDEP